MKAAGKTVVRMVLAYGIEALGVDFARENLVAGGGRLVALR